MDPSALLLDLYGRIPPLARAAVDGADIVHLVASPTPGANSIAWLIWHTARVQDHHVAELLDEPQIWSGGGWAAGFGLDPDPSNTGYGHSEEEAASLLPGRPAVLVDYLEAVQTRTVAMLGTVSGDELDRVVDDGWDPPVTMGVRLISVADDSLQHLGQAAYLRGLLDR